MELRISNLNLALNERETQESNGSLIPRESDCISFNYNTTISIIKINKKLNEMNLII